MHRKRVARNSRLHRGIHHRLVVRCREREMMEPVAPQILAGNSEAKCSLPGSSLYPLKIGRYFTLQESTADHCKLSPLLLLCSSLLTLRGSDTQSIIFYCQYSVLLQSNYAWSWKLELGVVCGVGGYDTRMTGHFGHGMRSSALEFEPECC